MAKKSDEPTKQGATQVERSTTTTKKASEEANVAADVAAPPPRLVIPDAPTHNRHLRSKFRVDAVEPTGDVPHHAPRHRVKLSPVHSTDDAHAPSVTPLVFDIHSEAAKDLRPGLEYFLDLSPV